MKTQTIACKGALALLLAACAKSGPDYTKPDYAHVPASFDSAGPQAAATPMQVAGECWWTVYGDSFLNAAVEAAHRFSPSLELAAARLAEARAVLGASESALEPSLDASAGSQLMEGPRQSIPIPGSPVSYRVKGDKHRAAIGASYELDLWGRISRSVESAGARLEASEADQRGVRLALEADLASAVFALRAALAEKSLLEQTAELRRDWVNLLEERSRAGLSNEMDLARARADLASVEADLASVERLVMRQNHAISALCGMPVADVGSLGPLPAMPPSLPPGLPVDMLARRPDIAQAEALLHARMAEVGVAEVARYPRIAMTGSAGFENGDLVDLLSRPGQFWQLGPSLSVPLLDGGRQKADLEAARARVEQALAVHRQLTIQALREVEDSLSDLGSMYRRDEALGRAGQAAAEAEEIAHSRHKAGYVTFLELLDARRNLLALERSRVQNSGVMYAASVQLVRALGGGWGGN